MIKLIKQNILYIALIQTIAATLGSLYFSDIRDFIPCILCWYQRVFMYPLSIILAVGIIRKDKGLHFYVLPLSIIGALVAFYQSLLQWSILPETVAPCTNGVSCAVKQVGYFGFITIPFMSFVAFLVITVCMLIYKGNQRR